MSLFSRFVTLLILVSGTEAAAQIPPSDLEGSEFRNWLRENYYEGRHRSLGYRAARRAMYNFIDNNQDAVVDVYGGLRRELPYGGEESNPGPINAEHTVPQSFFDYADPMKSDLHHLFPTYTRWNSTRKNHPFREIPDEETTKWMVCDWYETSRPSEFVLPAGEDSCRAENLGHFSEYARGFFEPREDHKGNVARAVFYFYAMYPFELSEVGSADWRRYDCLLDELHQIRKDRIDFLEFRRKFR